MPMGPICMVSKPCECGDMMRYRKSWLRGWRLECICGRCGPWRTSPETQRATPFVSIDRFGHQPVSIDPARIRKAEPGVPDPTTVRRWHDPQAMG